jgi:hypothetical protein
MDAQLQERAFLADIGLIDEKLESFKNLNDIIDFPECADTDQRIKIKLYAPSPTFLIFFIFYFFDLINFFACLCIFCVQVDDNVPGSVHARKEILGGMHFLPGRPTQHRAWRLRRDGDGPCELCLVQWSHHS